MSVLRSTTQSTYRRSFRLLALLIALAALVGGTFAGSAEANVRASGPPDTPYVSHAYGGNNYASIGWVGLVGEADGYTVHLEPGHVAYSVDASTTSARIDGLSNGTTY